MRRYLALLALAAALVACGQPSFPAVTLPTLPEYPNSTVVETSETTETVNGRAVQQVRRQNFLTFDPVSEVVDWYSAELPKQGWTLSTPQMTVLQPLSDPAEAARRLVHAERPGCPIIYVDVVVSPEDAILSRVAIEEGAKACP